MTSMRLDLLSFLKIYFLLYFFLFFTSNLVPKFPTPHLTFYILTYITLQDPIYNIFKRYKSRIYYHLIFVSTSRDTLAPPPNYLSSWERPAASNSLLPRPFRHCRRIWSPVGRWMWLTPSLFLLSHFWEELVHLSHYSVTSLYRLCFAHGSSMQCTDLANK